jgi:tape measure domain-containing protein
MDGTAEVVDSTNRIGSGLSNLGAQAQAANNGLGTLRTALAGIATLATAVVITKMADSVTTLRTQLNLSAVSAQQAAQAYESLFQIAQKGRVSFTELGTTYAAIARAGNEMGVSQTRLLAVTESISQAMTIGGGSAQSMQAALVQLGQGLSSGTLRGEELNSIMEQTPRLAKAIADGLGVPIGELRKLGETGQLTAQQVINALEKSGPQLAKEMASATLTVGQAMTLLGNSATKMVGEMDAASGASATLASAVKGISGAMDTVGKVIKDHETAFKFITYTLGSAAVVAGLYGTAVAIGAVWAAVTLGGSVAVTAALAALGAVIGLSIAAGSELSQTEGVLKISLAKINNEIDAAEKAKKSGLVASLNARKKLLEDELADKRQKTVEMNMIGGQQSPDRVLDRIAATEGQAAQKAYQALKFELSGVNKEFTTHLNLLQARRGSADYSEKQYIEDVIELINKEGGARKAANAVKKETKSDAWQADVAKAYTKALEDLNKEELKATAIAEGYTKTQEILRGVMASPEFAAMSLRKKEEIILAAAQAEAESDRAVALTKSEKAHKDYIAGLTSSADSVAKNVAALKDETAAYAVAAEKNISLAEAIDLVAIARLEEEVIRAKITNDDKAVAQLEREIELRKKLAPLIRQRDNHKAEIEAGKDAQKAVQAEWKKGWEETDRLARDAFTGWAENGTSMADAIGKSLKKALLSAIYEATLKPIAFNLYTSIMGGGAAGGSGGVLGTLGTVGNAYSGASALGSAYTVGSQYVSGTMSGANAIGTLGANATGTGIDGLLASNGAYGTASSGASSMSSLGTVGVFLLAATAISSMLKGGDYVKSLGASDQTFGANGTVKTALQGYANPYGGGLNPSALVQYKDDPSQASAFNASLDANTAANKVTAGMYDSYKKTALYLGVKVGDVRFAYGSNDSEGGKTSIGGGSYNSGEFKTSPEAMNLAASRAVFSALQGSELPGYLAQVFNGITADTATQAQINDTLAYASSLKTLRDTLSETRTPLEVLQENVAEGFATLGTSADTFKRDFVAAIDAGIQPENLADWQTLGANIDAVAESAKTTALEVEAVDKALQKSNQSYQDQIDLLTGKETERSLALREAADSTDLLINKLYDLKDAAALTARKQSLTDKYANPMTLDEAKAALPAGNADNLLALSSTAARKVIGDYISTLSDPAAITQIENLSGAFEVLLGAIGDTEQAAKDAADKETQRLEGVASERSGLETNILQLTKNTVELRSRELAALDATNRGLKSYIYTLEDMAAAQTAFDSTSKSMSAITKAMASAKQNGSTAGMTTYGKFFAESDFASALTTAFDGSLESLQELSSNSISMYQEQLQLVQSIRSASESVSATFQDSIRTIKLDMLQTPDKKYDFFDNEAQKFRDILSTLTDPTAIALYSGKLNSSIMAGYGTLDDTQKQTTGKDFISLIDAAETLTMGRFNSAQAAVQSSYDTLASKIEAAITKAVSEAMTKASTDLSAAADKMADAADSMPTTIEVKVSTEVAATSELVSVT